MKIHFPSFPALTALKESVLSNLSPRHKQILAIASIALALLAAAYLVTRRCFFKATPNVESKPLDEQDRISDKKEEIINEEGDDKISEDDPQVITALLENEKLTIPFDRYLELAKQAGPDLKRLKLNKTAVTDQQLEDLVKACPSIDIEKLDLSYTQITDNCLAHLTSLASLQSLNLRACNNITDAGLAHLTSLASLQSLNLEWCNITDAGLAHLTSLVSLQSLDLTGCKNITDAGLAHLTSLASLRISGLP